MATIDIYLVTKETIVYLTREMSFERIPAVGEFVIIDAGGLLPHEVTEVVHDVDGSARVVLGVYESPNGEYEVYEEESDFREDVAELQKAGWTIASETSNTVYKNEP